MAAKAATLDAPRNQNRAVDKDREAATNPDCRKALDSPVRTYARN